ncbi:MAG: hypothetical protein HFE04_01500 [Bacilli bacterium]|nr:hypothetical protein [Bacilli bacterium]
MNKINKIQIRGNVKILSTKEGKYVTKPKKKDLTTLFNYLNTRGIDIYPEILEETKEEIKYKYYEDNSFYSPTKDEDLIKTISSLHYKTTYYKDVSRRKYKDIYNTLIGNIDYLKEYYDNLIRTIDFKIYMSPSDYLLARNYTIINSNLIFIEKELNSWYNLVKDKTKEKVCIIHNNLKRENFIEGEKTILTGWDNYLVDTRILDIYKLYKKEYKSMDFTNLLKIYNEEYPLDNEETKLLQIMISMPRTIEQTNSEYDKIKEINSILDYIYRTNELIKTGVLKSS